MVLNLDFVIKINYTAHPYICKPTNKQKKFSYSCNKRKLFKCSRKCSNKVIKVNNIRTSRALLGLRCLFKATVHDKRQRSTMNCIIATQQFFGHFSQ